jgi:hypothetical protein
MLLENVNEFSSVLSHNTLVITVHRLVQICYHLSLSLEVWNK